MTCETCGNQLQRGSRGPARRFCDDTCRKQATRLLRLPTGQGGMSRAAEGVAFEARARRTLDASEEAALAALAVVGAALDSQPANASLILQWRGLLHDLRQDHLGETARDLNELLRDFRGAVGRPNSGGAA